MKIISYIMIAMIITLSAIPCCENDKCLGGEDFCMSENTAENSDDDCLPFDLCSPFLNCTSCTGFVVSTDLHIDKPLQILQAKKLLAKTTDYHLKTVFSFFHPPKV